MARYAVERIVIRFKLDSREHDVVWEQHEHGGLVHKDEILRHRDVRQRRQTRRYRLETTVQKGYICHVTNVNRSTGYGGVSSKSTTTTSDCGHMNGFIPNGGGGGSNGGVWTGETLSSHSGKSSVESRQDNDRSVSLPRDF